MIRLAIVAAVAVLSLHACATAPADVSAKIIAVETQALDTGREACELRDRVYPFVVAGEALASAVLPAASAWVALDVSTVAPALRAACQGIGGAVVAPPKK